MKLKTLDELEKIVETSEKKVILCHGVFDLFHLGHLTHLKDAKKYADILIVTVTPDIYVNKGPGRPVFSERQRAEIIASLELVDYVGINEFPTAEETILKLKPDYFAKGAEFDNKSDLDGAVLREKEVIESVGGQMIYTTDEVVYSSSNLINNFNYSLLTPEADAYLKDFRNNYTEEEVFSYLDKIKDTTVLVIGDAIIDEYVYGQAIGKSSKDPTLVIQENRSEIYAGGSLAVANHISEFCKKVILITYIGENGEHEDFIKSSLHNNIEFHFIYKKNSPTIVKKRFIDEYFGNKLLESYKINQEPLDSDQEKELIDLIDTYLPQSELALVSDFGHGLMENNVIHRICSTQNYLAVNAQCNAGNLGYNFISKYFKGNLFVIDEKELRMETRDRFSSIFKLLQQCYYKVNCDKIIVTRGSNGSDLCCDSNTYFCPALATKIVDRVGAGDAFFAIASLASYVDAPPDIISFLGNVAGSLGVQIIGNKKHITEMDLRKSIHYLMK